MKNLTIKEIADMADVSPTAVSFVLNDRKGVSDETRKKVKEIIERTNFRPNRNSQRLYYQKSFNITILVKETSSPFKDLFYFDITKGVLNKSREYGYNIVFANIPQDDDITLQDIIKQEDSDGIICYQDMEQEILEEIKESNIPFVVVDAHFTNSDITSINTDYTKAAYIATEYLIEHNHKDIGFICSNFIPDFYVQCFSGFKNALKDYNLSLNPSWIQDKAEDEDTANECMKNILKSDSIPTAIFCAVDMFAIGAIRCAKENNYNVPEDISFIGIDDILLSRYISPPLTTIKIDKIKMGEIAIDLLVKKIEDKKVESKMLEMTELAERDSVCSRK